MKPLYLFVQCILLTATLAQALPASGQDTSYFTFFNTTTLPQFASYYRITVHTDSGWIFSDYWMNDRLKTTGRVTDDMKTRVGTFTYFDSAGIVARRCKYIGHGGAIETDYFPQGQVMLQGTTLDEVKSGEWSAYYPSGKIKAQARYTDGQVDTATFFNEDGSPNNTMKVFYQEAAYPGGDVAWLQFLTKNLRYPDAAAINNIQGTVIVQFRVDKDGKTSDFIVIQSRGNDLDDEALRVMKRSGDWIPAIRGGTPVNSYRTQPVVFRVESF